MYGQATCKCGKVFQKKSSSQAYCSINCTERKYYGPVRAKRKPGVTLATGSVGAASELAVACDLILSGWAVFRAVSPHCFCDLIAVKGNVTMYLEVRSGSYKQNGQITFPTKFQAGVTHFAVYTEYDQMTHYFDVNMGEIGEI